MALNRISEIMKTKQGRSDQNRVNTGLIINAVKRIALATKHFFKRCFIYNLNAQFLGFVEL